MYENIGGKIKGLAKVIFGIEAVAAVIAGISILASGNDDLAFVGLLVIVGGPILAWASSLVLYGFGELIEKACEIEQNTRGEEIKPKPRKEANFKAQVEANSARKNLENSLKSLGDARALGIITEEEYQKQKEQLLLANFNR